MNLAQKLISCTTDYCIFTIIVDYDSKKNSFMLSLLIPEKKHYLSNYFNIYFRNCRKCYKFHCLKKLCFYMNICHNFEKYF